MTNTTNAARTWSPEQNAIFAWFAQAAMAGILYLVVRARAGTGKTTTILEGVDRAPEGRILVAAFNREIADEVKARLRNPRAEAKTLHGLGFGFIGRNWRVTVDKTGKVARDIAAAACSPRTPDAIVDLVARLHTKVRELAPFATPEDVADIAADFDILPDEEWEARGWNLQTVAGLAHAALTVATAKRAQIDFADMIFLPLANNWVRPTYDLVVIDEAQDMTIAQLDLATRACKRGGRIAIVGDDRQAIYGFRGADSGSLDRLKKALGAAELGLTTTYRCPKAVVAQAQQLVQDYRAADTAPDGEVLGMVRDRMMIEATEGDFILSRKNAPLASIALGLLKQGKRARIRGKDIGKGLLAVVKRQRARTLVELIAGLPAWVEREAARARRSMKPERAEDRAAMVADQAATIEALADGLASVAELTARLEHLFSDDRLGACITCSTVHKAKGLEADSTFLLEDTFTRRGPEEDNIRYVAITRAKRRLVWVAKPAGQE